MGVCEDSRGIDSVTADSIPCILISCVALTVVEVTLKEFTKVFTKVFHGSSDSLTRILRH